MGILPKKTANKHLLMARNYDFNSEMEEMCFAYTSVTGKYSHISSTLNLFGRADGMNEHGLAVCKASNGLPVGNFKGGKTPNIDGFSFWVVVRALLENCQDINEAIEWIEKAPIAYNLSLMLADKTGRLALIQTMDGHKAYKIIDENSSEEYLSCTNHTVLTDLKKYEEVVISNSIIRNDMINNLMSTSSEIAKNQIKTLMMTPYPKGLCCHFYEEYFGTLRSMIFDVNSRTVDVAFGSSNVNLWQSFSIEPFSETNFKIKLPQKKTPAGFYQIE